MNIDNQLAASIGVLNSEINTMRLRRVMRDTYGLNFAQQTAALKLIKHESLSVEIAVEKVIWESKDGL